VVVTKKNKDGSLLKNTDSTSNINDSNTTNVTQKDVFSRLQALGKDWQSNFEKRRQLILQLK
jgi:hypothetical protein